MERYPKKGRMEPLTKLQRYKIDSTAQKHRFAHKRVQVYGRKCQVCGDVTQRKYQIDIQVDWFRGNDERIIVCEECRHKSADELLDIASRRSPDGEGR